MNWLKMSKMPFASALSTLLSWSLFSVSARSWREISVTLFDSRWDGTSDRTLMGVCLSKSQLLLFFTLAFDGDKILKAQPFGRRVAISAASLRATRPNVWDLLVVKPDGALALMTHGVHEISMRVQEVKGKPLSPEGSVVEHGKIVAVQAASMSSIIVSYEDGYKARATLNLIPQDSLTNSCLQTLATTLPADYSFHLHRTFLEQWWSSGLSSSAHVQFSCFVKALYEMLELKAKSPTVPDNPWERLGWSRSHNRNRDDPALRQLSLPMSPPASTPVFAVSKPHPVLSVILYALHILAENFRLLVHLYDQVTRLAPVVCRIALEIRPEWADYWKRLVPDATASWPSPSVAGPPHLLI